MKTCPTMRKLITRIAKKHGHFIPTFIGERRLTLELEGFAPLDLVVSEDTVSVSQIEQETDEFYPDPEVLFYTGGRGWVPIHASEMGKKDEFYAKPDWKRGGVMVAVPGEEKRQAERAQKCEQWARDLQEQGWLERGKRPQVQA